MARYDLVTTTGDDLGVSILDPEKWPVGSILTRREQPLRIIEYVRADHPERNDVLVVEPV